MKACLKNYTGFILKMHVPFPCKYCKEKIDKSISIQKCNEWFDKSLSLRDKRAYLAKEISHFHANIVMNNLMKVSKRHEGWFSERNKPFPCKYCNEQFDESI